MIIQNLSDRVLDGQIKAQEKKLATIKDSKLLENICSYLDILQKEKIRREKLYKKQGGR